MPSPAHDRQLIADLSALDRPVPELLPLVTCACCRHFTPDRINRVAGMGFCVRLNGWNYPGTQRHCRAFEDARYDAGHEA